MKRVFAITFSIIILALSLTSCKPTADKKADKAAVSSDKKSSVIGVADSETKKASSKTTEPAVKKELTEEDKLAVAPKIDGFTKEFQGEKIVYIAAKGNTYNINEGEVCGYFAPETYLDGEKVGGVALSSTIVESMITTKLANNEPDCIPIPVDPNNGQKINIEYSLTPKLNPDLKSGIFYISTDNLVNITNPFLNKDKGTETIQEMNTTLDGGKTLLALFLNTKLLHERSSSLKPANVFDRLILSQVDGDFILNRNNFNGATESSLYFGNIFASLDKGTLGLQKGSYDSAENYAASQLSKSELLRIDDCVVFIQSN